MQKNQWPDIASFVAGGCLAASPWFLGFGEELSPMLYNALAAGLALSLLALVGLFAPRFGGREHPELPIISLVIGLWTVASPWVLAFASLREIAIATVVCGGLAAVAALWQIVDRYQHTHHLFE